MTAIPFSFPVFAAFNFCRTDSIEAKTEDETLARRDFIRDMIDSNPDAFASELDVYEMMSHLPGKF
jgi:hypothetical protein